MSDDDFAPVPFALAWRDDGTAASARNPDAHYRTRRLAELGTDWECEFVCRSGTAYIGIYATEGKARAAAEYHELLGILPPALPFPVVRREGADWGPLVSFALVWSVVLIACVVLSLTGGA